MASAPTRLNGCEHLHRSLICSMSGRLIDQASNGTARSFAGDVVRVSSRIRGDPRLGRNGSSPNPPIASMRAAIPLRWRHARQRQRIVVYNWRCRNFQQIDTARRDRPNKQHTGIPETAGIDGIFLCRTDCADNMLLGKVRHPRCLRPGWKQLARNSFMRFRYIGCPRYLRLFYFLFFFLYPWIPLFMKLEQASVQK